MDLFKEFGSGILAIVSAIIGLAILAVIVSKNSATPQVIQAASTALASVIGKTVAPVTNNQASTSASWSSFNANSQ